MITAGETVLCTDGHAVFERLDTALGVTTIGFVASHHGAVRDSVFHVQSVNSYHGRLKAWIARKLRGVATKYLAHYLAWMRLRSWRGSGVTPRHLIVAALGRQTINI